MRHSIHCENPDIFAVLIQFFYRFTLAEFNDPILAVLIYQVADKYDVPGLRKLAANRFEKSCDPKNNFEAFGTALKEIDERTAPNDKTLWEIVVPLVKQNMGFLLAQKEFKSTIKEINALYFRLLEEWSLDDSGENAAIDPALLADGGTSFVSIGWGGGRVVG